MDTYKYQNQVNDYYLDQITIKAKLEFPRQPVIEISTDRSYANNYLDGPIVPASQTRIGSISGIDLDHWDITLTRTHSDNFKKVAEIVGDDKASEVLTALGLR